MTIRTKALLVICVTVCSLITVTYFSCTAILRRSSTRLEEEYTRETIARAQAALAHELEGMERSLGDWAIWDDCYHFVQFGNWSFIRKNLADSTFSELDINLMLFTNRSGTLVYAKDYRPLDPSVSVQERSRLLLDQPTPLFAHREASSCLTGLVMLPDGPMLVASRPILRSSGTGAIGGTLLIGRYLSADAIRAIAAAQRLNMQLARLTGPLSQDSRQALGRLSPKQPVAIRVLNRQTVAGYTVLPDINGKPAVLLRVDRPRTVSQQNEMNLYSLLLALAIIGVGCGLFSFGLLEKTVLSRLRSFCTSVLTVGATGDLSARVPTQGRDEFVQVASAVNDMLTSLESSQEFVRQQKALAESERRYRQLVELSPDAVIIFVDGRCAFINDAGLHLLGGHENAQVAGRLLDDFLCTEDRSLFMSLTTHPHRRAEKRPEIRFNRLDGTPVDVEVAVNALEFGGHAALQVIAHDITERKVSAERLNYLAYHDMLTQLPNRVLFKDRLAQAIAWAKRKHSRVAVMMLDLDRFKEINDALGHDVGDSLLQVVAERLSGCLRSMDLIARIGGDEFLLFFQEVNALADAERLAERVYEQFKQPFTAGGHELYITPSIGVSLYPTDNDTIETLIKYADMAMYRAKMQGRNGYQFFSQEMHVLTSERHQIEVALRKAIEREEISVHYQPQINLATGDIIGVEALTRFPQPELRGIAPSHFIPIIEETGMIERLDDLVLAKACAQLRAWREEGIPPFRVSVNLSARIFRRRNLVDRIVHLLDTYAIPAQDLEIEITESTAVENLERTLETLTRLHDIGVRIAIDDFGTGYSSFSHLKSLPIDTLKIDRTFIFDALSKPDNATIVQAIVAMTHALHIDALAEGVETEEQVAFLTSLSCHIAQGYYYSHPIPPEQIPGLFLTPAIGR